MKKILLMSFMVVSFFGFNKAQAGFMVEPHFGMLLNSTYSDPDGDVTGNTLGVKLGWKTIGFNFGLNYRTGSHKIDYDDGGNAEGDLKMYSLYAGYDFPMMFRVWGEYVMSNSEVSFDGGSFEDASGTVFGIGYRAAPFVSINLEIGSYEFGENDDGNKVDADFSTTTLGVSFPFSL